MQYLDVFKNVVLSEASSLTESATKVSDEQMQKLSEIYSRLISQNGALVFCGVGKSGIIAKKLSSTFSSLGLKSFFLHPVEALHGDLGNVHESDAFCFISNSGTTEEILKLLPFIRSNEENFIGLLGDTNSAIAKNCHLVFDCSVTAESCKNNLAPTNSSTLALAMGDAMAVFYEHFVDLSKEGFAINHPGGLLGKSLSIKVKDLMVDKSSLPILTKDTGLKDIILEMTNKPYGLAAILDGDKLIGIIVEGDIRRSFAKNADAFELKASDIMTKNPVTINSTRLALDAINLMENKDKKISVLPVVDDETFLGLIRLHELFNEGFSKRD
jgi:arabinose-5-phosphate isomerase